MQISRIKKLEILLNTKNQKKLEIIKTGADHLWALKSRAILQVVNIDESENSRHHTDQIELQFVYQFWPWFSSLVKISFIITITQSTHRANSVNLKCISFTVTTNPEKKGHHINLALYVGCDD